MLYGSTYLVEWTLRPSPYIAPDRLKNGMVVMVQGGPGHQFTCMGAMGWDDMAQTS